MNIKVEVKSVLCIISARCLHPLFCLIHYTNISTVACALILFLTLCVVYLQYLFRWIENNMKSSGSFEFSTLGRMFILLLGVQIMKIKLPNLKDFNDLL